MQSSFGIFVPFHRVFWEMIIFKEKIKMLCNRSTDTVLENNKEGITEIEKHSKSLLNQYATMLNNSAVPFHKETSII